MKLNYMYEKISGLVSLEIFDIPDTQKAIEKEFSTELLYLRNMSVDTIKNFEKTEIYEILRIYDVYFRVGLPIIDDRKYDEFYTFYETPDAKPIMFEPSINAWKKVKHDIPMGSLNKCNTIDEIELWNMKKEVVKQKKLISEKLDGISCIHKGMYLETDQGKKTIDDIVENELELKVKSYNHDTGMVEYKKVVSYQSLPNFENKKWVKVKAKNSKGDIVELITTTDHYWYSTATNEYKMIKDFRVGDKVFYSK